MCAREVRLSVYLMGQHKSHSEQKKGHWIASWSTKSERKLEVWGSQDHWQTCKSKKFPLTSFFSPNICRVCCMSVLERPWWSSGEVDNLLDDVVLGVKSLSCWLMCFLFLLVCCSLRPLHWNSVIRISRKKSHRWSAACYLQTQTYTHTHTRTLILTHLHTLL